MIKLVSIRKWLLILFTAVVADDNKRSPEDGVGITGSDFAGCGIFHTGGIHQGLDGFLQCAGTRQGVVLSLPDAILCSFSFFSSSSFSFFSSPASLPVLRPPQEGHLAIGPTLLVLRFSFRFLVRKHLPFVAPPFYQSTD